MEEEEEAESQPVTGIGKDNFEMSEFEKICKFNP